MTTFPLPYASQDLGGQVALVTGASAGLGSRFARVLAARGAKVAIAARRLDKLEALADEIRAAGGIALPLQLDVTDADQLVNVVAQAQSQLGLVQILVNNAGIPDAQRAHKMSVELIDRVLDINVRAPWILSCEVARRLIEAEKPGRIVNMASRAAYAYDGRGAALYATSKMAVVRMITKNFPRPRLGDPAQLDSTLLYLVSPASEFVTGTTVRVDDAQGGR